ncbi:MAG TPA: hypothetical protein VEC37_08665, partial [Bacillota bacterium]|nr:hypothetical protein [Bacillota bacterium]
AAQGSNQVVEVVGEGAGGLCLCSYEAALAKNYQIDAEIVGFYSGGSRKIWDEVDALLAESGMRREDLVLYTSAQPFNQAAVFLRQEARQQFGSDRLITTNQAENRSLQYFGLNGLIGVMQAVTDLKEKRYQNIGAAIMEADWDGRFAVVLLKMI